MTHNKCRSQYLHVYGLSYAKYIKQKKNSAANLTVDKRTSEEHIYSEQS